MSRGSTAPGSHALGSRFHIRHFPHILKEGAMPLTIFERRVDERIKAKLAAANCPEYAVIIEDEG